MLGATFLTLWVVNLFMYLKLRQAIHNESSEVFSNIFGLRKPFQKSLRFTHVALSKSCWSEFKSPRTIKWLRLHWISAIAFYGYGIVVILYFILSRI